MGIFKLRRYPDSIVFRVDGLNFYTYSLYKLNPDGWPFFADHYILLNVAMINEVVPGFTESEIFFDNVRVYLGQIQGSMHCINLSIYLSGLYLESIQKGNERFLMRVVMD